MWARLISGALPLEAECGHGTERSLMAPPKGGCHLAQWSGVPARSGLPRPAWLSLGLHPAWLHASEASGQSTASEASGSDTSYTCARASPARTRGDILLNRGLEVPLSYKILCNCVTHLLMRNLASVYIAISLE